MSVGNGALHEQVFEAQARKWMDKPDSARALLTVRQAVKDKRWNGDGLVDALGQPFGGWKPGQVCALSYLMDWLDNGDVGRVKVEVGSQPERDSARAFNAFALDEIAHPFTAALDVEQNNDDSDGQLSWSETIVGDQGFGGEEFSLTPWSHVPLEVGYTGASRTWMHLWLTGAVARWPYGSTWAWVFVGLPNPHEFALRIKRDYFDFIYKVMPPETTSA